LLEIVGAGFGRTGTLSLKQALERLGFGPCHHMVELLENPGQLELWTRVAREGTGDWDEVYRGYHSTVDWPGARYWRELTSHFPQAKVILTVRDAERWYESAAESIYRASSLTDPDPWVSRLRQFVNRVVWEGDFGGGFDDAEHAIRVFNEHNEAVRREIPADRLLVFEVREGWEPLCAFLGVPVPDEPFPHANDRQAFTEMVQERLNRR
jgi:Sulfotransferase domain